MSHYFLRSSFEFCPPLQADKELQFSAGNDVAFLPLRHRFYAFLHQVIRYARRGRLVLLPTLS